MIQLAIAPPEPPPASDLAAARIEFTAANVQWNRACAERFAHPLPVPIAICTGDELLHIRHKLSPEDARIERNVREVHGRFMKAQQVLAGLQKQLMG
jgi:hypothetical protein